MGKKEKMKEKMVSRIPLPSNLKVEKEEEEETELDPMMEKILENFKDLCGVKKGGLWEDFIKVSVPTVKHPSQFSVELDAELDDDKYMNEENNIIVHTKPNIDSQEDFSAAAPAVIQEKIGKKKAKLLRKEEREKTKGKDWFGLPALELTDERRQDLELLQMRGALDPKRFYKKSDLKNLPKYFQIGTVVDSPYDFYSDRIPKKDRKRTMVDELLADAEFKRYNKRKYVQIIEDKARKDKRFNKKKKKSTA